MNFEEKVLTALNSLTEKVEKIETVQAEQGKHLAEQGKQLSEITVKVNRLEKKIDRDVIPYVKLLDEDYSRIGRRVTALEKAK